MCQYATCIGQHVILQNVSNVWKRFNTFSLFTVWLRPCLARVVHLDAGTCVLGIIMSKAKITGSQSVKSALPCSDNICTRNFPLSSVIGSRKSNPRHEEPSSKINNRLDLFTSTLGVLVLVLISTYPVTTLICG